MRLLAAKHYDPAVAASASTASLLAITALDTTNLRVTFTAPSNGKVLVRLRGNVQGGTTSPSILFGVLDGATVKLRLAPIWGKNNTGSNAQSYGWASGVVSGLTPGTSYTWDAAYGVEFAVASSAIKYGGPNNTTGSDAFGSFALEVWDTPGLLDSKTYDPGTAVNTPAVSASAAMAALDTTNLRCTFAAPSSGAVLVRVRVPIGNATALTGAALLGVMDGATVKGRVRGMGWLGYIDASALATQINCSEGLVYVSGLTPGTTYNYDAAIGVELAMTAATVAYGGPDNATQNDAWGAACIDVWNPDSLPQAVGATA